MPKIKYVERKFTAGSLQMIETANKIIDEYLAAGFDMTLRQLYYQFVARGLIANKMTEYKRMASIINDGRLAGLIDWSAIVDRTRDLRALPHWESPQEIIEGAKAQYRIDKWAAQANRVEVWVEKDALVGVVARICNELDVPYFSCRGYTSQSEMWEASQRLLGYVAQHQTPVVIHLGDHDPSGLDMTHDIIKRFEIFIGGAEVKRIALNMSQVEKYNPPPNPAKTTDARAAKYIDEFGTESWELDALDPKVLAALIKKHVLEYRDKDKWSEQLLQEDEHRLLLSKAADYVQGLA